MEKYGFVYIWFDRKHKRYYIGCRWGDENDGYVCSSPWMKQGYKHRPSDFRRKILSRVYSNKKDLLEEEYKWLSKIQDSELGKKYYNLHNHHFGHWSANETSKLTVGQKISASPLRNKRISESNKGKIISEETKQKLREANQKQFQDPAQVQLRKQKSKELWTDPEYLEKQRKARSKEGFYKGFTGSHSEKTKIRISNAKMGVKQSEESKGKISQSVSNLIWITNGETNKRINKLEQLPESYRRGRTKQL